MTFVLQLSLDALKDLALNAIISELSEANIVTELFSDFTGR